MQNFDELNLSDPLLKAIQELNYTVPSPIQAQTLPILLGEPTDFIGLAATGTGKTAAFSIPLLEKMDGSHPYAQALILCPTRELAQQVASQVTILGKYKNVKAAAIYGGSGYEEQIRHLRKGTSVIVGTPGRLIDHLNRGTLKLDRIHTVILDEADEMISMGFKDDLETLLSKVNSDSSHIWLFSATMSREVRRVADTYLKSPKQVQINKTEMLSQTIEQFYYLTHESNKPEVLCKLIEAAEDFYGIIFCQTKTLVSDLTQYLSERGYRVDSLHGDKDQNSRERTLKAYREKRVTILVCTDVASRGLDIKDITHVVNYSLPRELDNYVHRIGRTARSGKKGFAFNLVTPAHRRLIGVIEKATQSRMLEGKIPSRKEIGMKKVASLLEPFAETKGTERAQQLFNKAWQETLEGLSPLEVASRFLAMMLPDLFKAEEKPLLIKDAPPSRDRDQSRDRDRGPRRDSDSRSEKGRPYRKRR